MDAKSDYEDNFFRLPDKLILIHYPTGLFEKPKPMPTPRFCFIFHEIEAASAAHVIGKAPTAAESFSVVELIV